MATDEVRALWVNTFERESGVVLTVRIPETAKTYLMREAKDAGANLSEFVRVILREAIIGMAGDDEPTAYRRYLEAFEAAAGELETAQAAPVSLKEWVRGVVIEVLHEQGVI